MWLHQPRPSRGKYLGLGGEEIPGEATMRSGGRVTYRQSAKVNHALNRPCTESRFRSSPNICAEKHRHRKERGATLPSSEVCHLGVTLPTLMNGRGNEEVNSDGRRADSDHHVVTYGVLLDVQPFTIEFIPGSDVDSIV